MTRIHRWVTHVLGTAALGGAIAASMLTASLPAMALTTEEVADKLKNIPLFAIYNPELNNYPSATFEDESGNPISLVLSYVDRLDAEQILEDQRRTNKELGDQITVRPIPLSRVFLEIQSRIEKGEDPLFQILPDDEAIKAALAMRKQAGKPDEPWQGIPLFFTPNLGITQAGANGGQDRKILPMFFSRSDLDGYVAQAKQQNPDLVSTTIELRVTTLEKVLETLLNNTDPAFDQVEFLPPRDSLEYLIQQQRRNANTAPAPQ